MQALEGIQNLQVHIVGYADEHVARAARAGAVPASTDRDYAVFGVSGLITDFRLESGGEVFCRFVNCGKFLSDNGVAGPAEALQLCLFLRTDGHPLAGDRVPGVSQAEALHGGARPCVGTGKAGVLRRDQPRRCPPGTCRS